MIIYSVLITSYYVNYFLAMFWQKFLFIRNISNIDSRRNNVFYKITRWFNYFPYVYPPPLKFKKIKGSTIHDDNARGNVKMCFQQNYSENIKENK